MLGGEEPPAEQDEGNVDLDIEKIYQKFSTYFGKSEPSKANDKDGDNDTPEDDHRQDNDKPAADDDDHEDDHPRDRDHHLEEQQVDAEVEELLPQI